MLYQDRIVALASITVPNVAPQAAKPWGPEDAPGLAALAANMELLGQLTNVLVVALAGERYALIAGRRVYQAARSLGWEFLSVKVISGQVSDERLAAIAMAEDICRRQLSPDQVAAGLGRLAQLEDVIRAEDEAGQRPGEQSIAVQLMKPPVDHPDHWWGCNCQTAGPFAPKAGARR